MKSHAVISAFLVSLLLCGCYESENPLSAPANSKPDYDLAGLWLSKKDWNNHVYLHIIVDSNKQMKLIRVNHPVSNRGAVAEAPVFSIFPTKIDGQSYMNIEFMSPKEGGQGHEQHRRYWFYKYEISKNGILTVWGPTFGALEKTIAKGDLKGKAWETTWGSNVQLKSSPKELLNWLVRAKPGEELEEEGKYERLVKDSYKEF